MYRFIYYNIYDVVPTFQSGEDAVKKTVNLTYPQIVASAVAVAFVGAIIALMGFAVGKQQIATPPPAVASTGTVTQIPLDAGAAEAIPGTGSAPMRVAYRCKANFMSVQVPTGGTSQNGATYHLEQFKGEDGLQHHVIFKVTLPAGVEAPTIIVNTSAHNYAPDTYGNKVLQVALEPGATGEYSLETSAYADNYISMGGITDITVCMAVIK